MDNTRIVSLNVDWLCELSFSSVANAIKYLSKFDPEYILAVDQDVEICSDIKFRVPMTDEEVHKEKIKVLETQINCVNSNIRNAKTEYATYLRLPESAIKTLRQATLTYHESNLIELQNELNELTKND